ncbi:hypothetical protein [Tsukamurella sp. NPDC003166]|uniref:hypothetical protein n=1 Tax=Tsukamurella sp. NPDC003166 TaxID=3154444 RepID=UPI0033B19355
MPRSTDGLVRLLSDMRLAPYLRQSDDDIEKALELYRWSSRMSVSLFELVAHLEVVLRNAIDTALADHFDEAGAGIPWFLRTPPTTPLMDEAIATVPTD